MAVEWNIQIIHECRHLVDWDFNPPVIQCLESLTIQTYIQFVLRQEMIDPLFISLKYFQREKGNMSIDVCKVVLEVTEALRIELRRRAYIIISGGIWLGVVRDFGF
jgi:hypothetical protein